MKKILISCNLYNCRGSKGGNVTHHNKWEEGMDVEEFVRNRKKIDKEEWDRMVEEDEIEVVVDWSVVIEEDEGMEGWFVVEV